MKITTKYYNENAEKFIDSTFDCDMSDFYNKFLSNIKTGNKIIDLGFGSGRDSLYFKKNGYDVLSVDPSEEFIKRGNILGLNTVLGTIFDVEQSNYFDGIFACASLLHVEAKDLKNTFNEIEKKLKKGGILYCSFKYGSFSGCRNGRYFLDLNEATLTEYISHNLEILNSEITIDIRENNETKWLNVICKKKI